MILNETDYRYYYKCDLIASGIKEQSFKNRILDRRYRFYRSLRRAEYFTNFIYSKSIWGKILGKWFRFTHDLLCERYGWLIPINTCEKGLCLVHVGPIIVNGKAKIGQNARMNVGVNIGSAWVRGMAGAPKIGNNCYFGPGVKVFGPIEIGDNVAIGANAVVNSSFKEGGCTIGGIPAKRISGNTSERYIIKIE